MDNLQGTLLKGYKLEERIGSGGFGAVYRAKQTTIEREVAIKIILPGYANNPDFIRRFEAEAQLVARLEHPHITPLIDYWREPDGAYLVMRYLRGGSIRHVLQHEQYEQFELNSISQILDQLASALDFAHRNRVIHRDIKPGNILLDEDGNVYLADFGIAKDLAVLADNQTAADAVVGSLDYISPEQARSESVTPKTDIYSLGVTLYEMITGEHPFKEVSSVERLYKHINDPLPEIENLPDDVRGTVNNIIQKATAKNPEHRYADVMALAVAFRESIGRGGTTRDLDIVEQLTMREQEILSLITDGLSNREIADTLVVTVSTVKWHITQLYKKLGVRSRMQAIVRARELNLVVDDMPASDVNQISQTDISLPEPENPYKGLHAFQTNDSRDFFGRDDLTQKLINRLNAQDPFHRFLAIVGPSGSGKSSLVRAGVIPALWKGAIEGSDKWFVVDMIPGTHPIDKLETALIRVAANQANNLREQLQRDERGLLRVADIILPNDDTELVIVIDQFEEIFTLVEQEATRQHFLNLLLTAISDVRSRVRIVVTLRADYYDRPLHYPEFGQLIRTRMETVLPLSAKGLERAIRGPAERVGVTFEQGLVEQIVGEMNYQSGALPLLQYALTELFDRRDGRLLTNDAYQQIGGAVGALANRADEIYQSLTGEGQELAHQMFMRMVTLGEGAEDTRKRTPQSDLLALTDNTDLVEEIIDQFAAYRLLSLDHDPETRQPTVEVAHEAILREWERLRMWLNESRDEIRLQQQLSYAAKEWRDANQDVSFLLRGSRLQQFEAWAELTELILTKREQNFLQASIAERQHRDDVEAQRIAREQQQEKRSQTLLRALVAVFALATILSGGFGMFAFIQRNEAVDARNEVIEAQEDTLEALDIAQRSGLALTAGNALDTNEVDLAIALALESVGEDEGNMLPETLRILERIENSHGPVVSQLVPDGDCYPYSSRYSRYFIMIGCDPGNYFLSIWDITSQEEIAYLEVDDRHSFAGFSGDYSRMMSFNYFTDAWEDGVIVHIWDTETWEVIAEYPLVLPLLDGSIWYTADPNLILTEEISRELSDEDRRFWVSDSLSLRDALTGEFIREYRFDNIAAQNFDYSDDMTMGVVGGWSGFDGVGVDQYRAIVFDLQSGEILHEFTRPHNENHPPQRTFSVEVGFTDDDTKIYMSGYPNYIIDIETGLDDPRSELLVGTPMLRPSRNMLSVINSDLNSNDVYWTNMQTQERESFIFGNLFFSAYEPDQMITIEPGRLDEFITWDILPRLTSENSIRLRGGIADLEYSPDGRYIATVAAPGWGPNATSYTNILDANTLDIVTSLDVQAIPWGIQWSPDGRYLTTSTNSDGIILWDTSTWQEIRRFTGTLSYTMSVAFVDDGQSLLGAHGNFFAQGPYDEVPYIVKWNVETGEELRRYTFPDAPVPNHGILGIEVHPDGSVAYIGINIEQEDGQNDGVLSYLLNLETGEIQLIAQDKAYAYFLPDGDRLVITDIAKQEFTVYEYPSMDEILTASLIDNIWATDLSTDGRYLITGPGTSAFESAVSLYDIETGALVRRYFGHESQVYSTTVGFDPIRQQFASIANDTRLIVWDFDPTSTLDWIRENRLVRDFTCEERITFRIEPLCEDNQ